jgi:predicted RecA/RadA family phage recombinase
VFELPKLASAVITTGARVAWDGTAKEVVLPGTGMVPIGIATVRLAFRCNTHLKAKRRQVFDLAA